MKKCSKCGKTYEDDSKFCKECGGELVDAPVQKYCAKCGTAIVDGNKFCTGCGAPLESQQQSDMTPEVVEKKPNQSKKFRLKEVAVTHKPLVAGISVLLVCVIALIVTAVVKTGQFKTYLKEYDGVQTKYMSLGEYEDEYEEYQDDAKSIAGHFVFWKMSGQKKKMQELCKEIDELNAAVAEYKKNYDAIVKTMEKDSKYFLDDFEDKYNEQKTDFYNALLDFDVDECKKESEKFSNLQDQIIDNNKEKGQTYIDTVTADINGGSYTSCEAYLFGKMKDEMSDYLSKESYIDEQNTYNEYQNQVNRINNTYSSSDYIDSLNQVDVSEKGIIKLYLQANDTVNWNADNFSIYENKDGKNKWDKCELDNIVQVKDKGDLSIDIVADVSSSMDDSFYDMQNTVNSFVDSVDAQTKLGLAELSSVYTRKVNFTADKTDVSNAVSNLICHGSTSLYQSLYSSVIYTASSTGARCVIAFTDGINEPYDATFDCDEDDVINVARNYNVPVYIVGIGSGVESDTLEEIADQTGGSYHSIYDIEDLTSIYEDIYEMQRSMYQLTYKSAISNNKNRNVYVSYYNDSQNVAVRFEDEVDAELLNNAYTSVSSDNLASYYSKKKRITTADLQQLTDVNDIQTIINIYFAKNGYAFGKSSVIKQMKDLGAMKKNGSLSAGDAEKKIHKNKMLWQNYCALYNYRYTIIYNYTYDAIMNNPYAGKKEINRIVHEQIGESDTDRYKGTVEKAWKNIQNY